LDTIRPSRGRKKLLTISLSCIEKDDGFCGSGDESIKGSYVKKISQEKAEIPSHIHSDRDQEKDDFVTDLELRLAREQDERAECKWRNDDIINADDDWVPRLVSQMKRAANVNLFCPVFENRLF